ncbi:LPS translocon maturation chaperone LptM [Psychrobacter sp. CAL346-MNA-CIBAN-0220]|uniref:LPS translocon maturation chaperone LptM n=1 Tax=Psychrobacter sp. CAL346-MNA-CIBAN-0220 TaxID=3140457 RepID=UPI003331ECC0
MLIIPQIFNVSDADSSVKDVKKSIILLPPIINASYRIIGTLILGVVMIGVTGCGQKGALYLTDTDSQLVTSGSDTSASEVLDSTSHPQDAAFAGIDDDTSQKSRYSEQKQMPPAASDDPNDY